MKDYWETHYKRGGKGVHRWKTAEEFVLESAPFFKRKKVQLILDLGCGLGRHSVFLAKSGFFIVAADVSATALHKTRKNMLKEKLKNFILAEFDMYKRFPFAGECFDAVISVHTIHHNKLNKVVQVVEEIRRVLKKNGLALVSVKSVNDWSYGKGRKLEEDTFVRPRAVHQAGVTHHFFDQKQIKKLFSKFKIIKLKERLRMQHNKINAIWIILARR